jgi:putative ABC transport system permease protein
MDVWQPTLMGPLEPERPDGHLVSERYFRVLGVEPAIGRDFQASDDVHGGLKVVILGYALWRRRSGGDSKIIGRYITLENEG